MRTPVEAYTLRVSQAEHFLHWQQDPFGNHQARLVFPQKTTELDITVGLVADLQVINPFDFFVEPYAEPAGFAYPADLAAGLQPYLHRPRSAVIARARASARAGASSLAMLASSGSRAGPRRSTSAGRRPARSGLLALAGIATENMVRDPGGTCSTQAAAWSGRCRSWRCSRSR